MIHELLKKRTPLVIIGLAVIVVVAGIVLVARGSSDYARDFRNGPLPLRTEIIFPEDPEAFLERGDILREARQYKDAARSYEKAVKANPADSAAYLRLVELYQNYSSEPFKADLVYERAVASGADSREILINYASFLEIQKRDPEKSLEIWTRAREKVRSESERRAVELKIKELRQKLGLPPEPEE